MIPASEYTGQLVGLCGFSRSGKDAIARSLGWHRAAFADALKEDLSLIVGLLGLNIEADKDRVRELLVSYGRLARSCKPSFWIDRLAVTAGAPRVVVSDVRYENEAAFIQGKGGVVFYVSRPGNVAANDEEAVSCLDVMWMEGVVEVRNDGTIEEAAAYVRHAAGKHFDAAVAKGAA
jgi:hypothetical protein